MVTSVHDICTDALQKIGAVAVEETPSAAELQGALTRLNEMIEAWNTERLAVYGVKQQTFSLQAGKASYTMGTGGDFNTDRPVRIEKIITRDAQGNDFSAHHTEDYQEYASIVTKTTGSVLPQVIWDDGDFPLRTLTYWPVPSDASYSSVIFSMRQIAGFTSLSDTVIVPPGYKRALKYNLSIELGPEYGKKATNDLIGLAVTSKADIKRRNVTIGKLQADTMYGGGGKAFNWLTGE